jgi:hypothetical protein
MLKKVAGLESKRESLYNELSKTGDFRRGIISVNYRKCGKGNCRCSKEGHSGHGPQYLWNTTIKGKSYAKNLKLGPELQKCSEEVANYRSFLKICDELVEVNERICDLRLVPEIKDDAELEGLKKNYKSCFGRNTKRSWTHNKHSL